MSCSLPPRATVPCVNSSIPFPLSGSDQNADDLPVDEKDKPVLSAAVALNCGALITGDRTHFDHLFGTAVKGVTIHSPALAVRSLLN